MGVVLAIENSNPTSGLAGVALGMVESSGAVRPLGVEKLAAESGPRDDLMPAIARLADRCGVTPRQIERVIVSVGPGGYTALRIAAATAKMIAMSTGARVAAAPSAAVAARRVTAFGPFAVALASKHDAAWVQAFSRQPDRAVHAIDAGSLRTAGDLAALHERGVRTLVGDRFVPIAIMQDAKGLGWATEAIRLDPVACLELSTELPDVDAAALEPLYAREPEAVTKWRALGKG